MEDNQNLSDIKDNSQESSNVAPRPNNSGISGGESGETLDMATAQASGATVEPVIHKPKRSLSQRVQAVIGQLNVYFLLFILVLMIAGVAAFISYRSSKNAAKTNIDSQTLSDADLQALKNNETKIGDTTQTLTIASNAIFSGRVLVKDSLDVAGTIRIGGSLNLPGITVSGTSAFENVQIGNNLSIAGNTSIAGTLTVQGNITVGGGATFAGTISAPSLAIDQLTMNQNLQLNRHIEAGGGTPGISSGSGVGGGGTVSINGADTAGTVNINFGAGPVAGILANITFVNSFYQTPHVVITPIGSNCAGLNYYVNRTTGGFSIGTTNGGPSVRAARSII